MASEAKRGLIRITTNYVRLFLTFVFGLALVPLLLPAIGRDGVGLIALMGSTVGIAAMMAEIIENSSIRELGAAYHSTDPDEFPRTYNSALLLSLNAGLITLAIFGVLVALMPWIFKLPDELVTAARWFVAVQGIQTFFTVALSPAYNMYQVTERMVIYNFWMTMSRAANVVAALVILMIPDMEPSRGVVIYGLTGSLVYIVFMWVAVLIMALGIDRRLIPRPAWIRRDTMRSLMHIGGWSFVVRLAMDLHVRMDNYLMNLWLGVTQGNLIFGGLALPLSASVRMIAEGINRGVSAVAARVSTAADTRALQSLTYHINRLQGVVVFPAAAVMLVLARPIMTVWVGKRLDDPVLLSQAVVLAQLLTVGMGMRAMSDGLVRVLYGAGYVTQYARLVLAGGIANPIISIILLVSLPKPLRYIGPACAFVGLMAIVHMTLLPIRGARLLRMPIATMFVPLIRPLLVTLFCAPILWAPARWIEHWSLVKLLAVVAAYGLAYSGLSTMFVFDKSERKRFGGAVARKLGRATRPAPPQP